jgi:SAM-dependent methyltransferase
MSFPLVYRPEIFNVGDLDGAKSIILTPERGRTTDERWTLETPYLADLIAMQTRLGPDSVVLDYGCGIGRMSKALIEKTGCRAIGADISNEMRAMAPGYVGSERFIACEPAALSQFGARCDVAIAVWVLQHCPAFDLDLAIIRHVLKPEGLLVIVNELGRCVPTNGGWADDGRDLQAEVARDFGMVAEGRLDPAVVTKAVSDRTFWAAYRPREMSRTRREMLERKQKKLARRAGAV